MSGPENEFWTAATEGNEARALAAVERGLIGVDACDAEGIPVVVHGAGRGWSKVVEALLRRGAKGDARTREGDQGALFVASMTGHVPVVKVLLTAPDVSPSAKYCGSEAVPPIVAAATRGFLPIIAELLQAGASIDEADAQGHTALHTACFVGNHQCAVFLVERGANVNAVSKKGAAPLAWAAHKGHLGTVKALLDKGALVNGQTAKAVAPSEIERIPLLAAARSNRLDVLRLLLDCGADMEAKNEKGESALHCAAAADALKCAQELLRRGADFGAVDSEMKTVVEKAGAAGKCETLEFLILWETHGGDPPAPKEEMPPENLSPSAAKKQWQPDFSKVDPLYYHLASWMGEAAALVKAAGQGELSVCRSLLESGADPNTCQKMTPLSAAVQAGHVAVAKLMLMNGADPSQESQKKKPLQWAEELEDEEKKSALVALLASPVLCGACAKQLDPAVAKRCGQCKLVKFCNVECQKQCWKRFHRRQCSIWKERRQQLLNRK